MSDLPPLREVDKDLGTTIKADLKFERCKHELELVSSTEARCKRCPAGWMGSGIQKLVGAGNK